MRTKHTTHKRLNWKGLIAQYMAPTGMGVLIGVLSTLGVSLPQLLDRTQKIVQQGKRLAQIEADISAYSRVIKRFYPLLSKDELREFFLQDAKTVLEHDEGSIGTDDWFSAQLKRSPEGAYFVWCEGGMNSETAGAFSGSWVTRPEAIRWAQKYVSLDEARKVFSIEELQNVSDTVKIELCGGGQAD